MELSTVLCVLAVVYFCISDSVLWLVGTEGEVARAGEVGCSWPQWSDGFTTEIAAGEKMIEFQYCNLCNLAYNH